MKMYTRKSSGDCFSTFQISSKEKNSCIYGSHIYVTNRETRESMADDIFEILNTAYDEIGGFRSFKDIERFISDSYLWYITYDGPQPQNETLDINKILTVSVFRRSHGLKMVGMANNRFPYYSKGSEERLTKKRNAKAAIQEHIRFVMKIGWAEVSDRLEKLFDSVAVKSPKYCIDPEILRDEKIFKNISIDLDGLHYYRPLRTGEEPVRKIAYGTIKI